ncbi:nickel pincer cofactor biosynthesis protein LarC [Knoellia sp. CPCC 206435]|uniref:nickel pincer cofactor biosynthesis protein LarC n=1 Tax=Knoellia terrae TaxID=3404797 RepID=UPI003B428B53
MTTHLWIDAGAGVAGDMLLAALVDAGAPLEEVQATVDAVLPGTVRLVAGEVTRAGLRACKVDVEVLAPDQPDRRWSDIRGLLDGAPISETVRTSALGVFALLARAEAHVHGVPATDVHFHEVGAWDSIADVVGAVAAVHLLGITSVSAGPVALGSGTARTSHGVVGVPAPATLELATGWQVAAGGKGELTTPTGMALIRGLTDVCEGLPTVRITASGTGAGSRDVDGRANVTRVVVGELLDAARATSGPGEPASESLWVLEANVDDLDPRLWPGVLAALMDAGAADAWLTPILMKKGRPAHTLSVLADDQHRVALRDIVLTHTSTLGVREHRVDRSSHGRRFESVTVRDQEVRVKLSLDLEGRVVHMTPEFEDVRTAAELAGIPSRVVLAEATAAAHAAGWDSYAGGPGSQCTALSATSSPSRSGP